MAGVYAKVVIVWILLIGICGYGIFNGIFMNIWFCLGQDARDRKRMEKKKLALGLGGQKIQPEDFNSTDKEQQVEQSMNVLINAPENDIGSSTQNDIVPYDSDKKKYFAEN